MRIRFITTPTSLMLPRGESWSEGDVADLSRDQAQRWIGLDVAVELPPEEIAEILAEANPPPAPPEPPLAPAGDPAGADTPAAASDARPARGRGGKA